MAQIAFLRLVRSQCRRIISSSAANHSDVANPRCTIPAAVMVHRRWASRAAAYEQRDSNFVIVYDKKSPCRLNQILQVTKWTTRLSVGMGLYLTFMPVPNAILQGSVVASVLAASLFMRGFMKFIILRVRWKPGEDGFQVEMMSDEGSSGLGSCYQERIRFDDITDAFSRPFFFFLTRNGNLYYIESTASLSKEFLNIMLGPRVHW